METKVDSIRNKIDTAIRLFFSQMGQLRTYIDDPSVQEIMINHPGSVWIESGGEMFKVDVDIEDVAVRSAIKSLASANNKDVFPVIDARAAGFRVAAALVPVGIKGNAICIRKHTRSLRRLDNYLNDGAFEPKGDTDQGLHGAGIPDLQEVAKGGQALADFFRWAVRSKRNIAIAGGTGSGKTTFMNALLAEIPESERILTIEDTAELIVTHPNSVSLETAEYVSVDRQEIIDIRRLVRLALRFRPDRIIVGEIRGAEAYDLLDAMNTGHQGGFCSLHADNARFALYRLESMVRMHPNAGNLPLSALRAQIANTFHVVVFCARSAGVRGPVEVALVNGLRDGDYELTTIFTSNRKESSHES